MIVLGACFYRLDDSPSGWKEPPFVRVLLISLCSVSDFPFRSTKRFPADLSRSRESRSNWFLHAWRNVHSSRDICSRFFQFGVLRVSRTFDVFHRSETCFDKNSSRINLDLSEIKGFADYVYGDFYAPGSKCFYRKVVH